jgi:glycosyltransferase involved in cell wall biosynthesis
MAKTKRVGLIFSYDEQWIAGAYYIMNLVNALNTLPANLKPKIIFYVVNSKDAEIVNQLGYTNYAIVYMNSKLPNWKRIINLFYRKIFKENRFLNYPNKFDLDVIFPCKFEQSLYTEKHWNGRIFWIPDFQELFLPQFFSQIEIDYRKEIHEFIIKNNYPVIFSSIDASNHFYKLYGNEVKNTFILNFAVTHPDFNHLNKAEVLTKFNIDRPFIFSPNQFWKHKNHKKLLEAIVRIKDQFPSLLVVFSGKESDYRNPDYFKSLVQFVAENNLQKNILFLGFIDREEQLLLIKEAECIVQPSLFEGWSTVIEDAKALNKFIIASNIAVHKEQLTQNYYLFNPNDKDDIANEIIKFLKLKPQTTKLNYRKHVEKFGLDFMKIINSVN